MASPSASSATLSINSEPRIIDDDEDHRAVCTGRCEDGEAIDVDGRTPGWRDVVYGVTYHEENGFVVGEEYFSPAPAHKLSASMRGASHPDERVLQWVLRFGNDIYKYRVNSGLMTRLYVNGVPMSLAPRERVGSLLLADMSPEFGPNSLRTNIDIGITTPLLEAIKYSHLENVKTLLEAGADPNGAPLSVMEGYAAFFLRFRPQIPLQGEEMGDTASRKEFLDLMDLPQISKLTLEEVEDRFVDGMAPFWCEEGFTPKDFYPNGGSIHSLVASASSGNTEIFDRTLQAGADASFWLSPDIDTPEPPTASSLSVSSPLHAAVEIGNLAMVKHLLDLNFDPNVLPLASPTRAYTPLQNLIIGPNFSEAIFDTLISHPSINPHIRTPIYQVHILHFAVARLDLDILRYISSPHKPKIPIRSAGVTALGHTLLHIACMPADSLHVQRRAEVIYRSVHETRDLRPFNDPHAQFPPKYDAPPSIFEGEFAAQTSIVKYLWENGFKDIEARDVHGNTALHYLAGCHSMNWGLLGWLYEVDGDVERVFREARNAVGATPGELACAAGECSSKFGWCEWFERFNSRARVKRKEEIWRGLLRNCGGACRCSP